MTVIDWLLESDPSIRWQVMRDLTGAPAGEVAAERARVATEGLGARLLALRSRSCSMTPTRSLSSATVVAVIVLMGGWSNVTGQYLGLRRLTLRCVQDRDHTSESLALLDVPVSSVFMSNS